MGEAQCKPDALQLRQMDLDRKERDFVNSVIHGKSKSHSLEFDKGLDALTKKHTPDNQYRSK
jgi:hypothetical protein